METIVASLILLMSYINQCDAYRYPVGTCYSNLLIAAELAQLAGNTTDSETGEYLVEQFRHYKLLHLRTFLEKQQVFTAEEVEQVLSDL